MMNMVQQKVKVGHEHEDFMEKSGGLLFCILKIIHLSRSNDKSHSSDCCPEKPHTAQKESRSNFTSILSSLKLWSPTSYIFNNYERTQTSDIFNGAHTHVADY